jgi:serine/threonine-protein phosphatase 2A regulatory subunit A
MTPAVSPEVVTQQIVPLALTMAVDPIPNIRFNVAKLFGKIQKFVDVQDGNEKIKPVLKKMTEDEDVDVRYFAQQSLDVY